MNRYCQYKHIELPWLSEIPAHWDVARNKNVFSEVKDTVGEDSASYTLLSLTLKGIIPRDLDSGKGKFPKDFDTYKIVKKGDMAFCLFDIDETPRTVGLSEYDGMLTGAYTILQVRNVNPRFSYYYYLALDNIKALRPLYSGLRKTINVGTFLGTKFPLPPRDEQDQIVRFLDWKVSQINRLINIKRKEIERLEELRQTAIAQTVRKSFVENTKTDSGIDWIGKIPKHWSVQKIKTLFSLRDERNYMPLNKVNLISLYTNLGVVQNKDMTYTSGNHARTADGYKIVYKNDIIVNIILCWMGAIGMSKYNGVTSPAYDVYIPHTGICSRYYHYLFRTKQFSGECYKVGKGIMAMRWRTYSPQFRKIDVPVPPKSEQIQIADYLDNFCAKYDDSIQKINQEIEKLREFRTRLISDVVTGKIDVRSIEIPNYEYVEEEAGEATENITGDMEENRDEE